MEKLEKDIHSAFELESGGVIYYMLMGEKARSDGFPGIAKLMRAFAASETTHALDHLRKLEKLKDGEAKKKWPLADTKTNMEKSAAGEKLGYTEYYPAMIKDAEAAKDKDATRYLEWICNVEKEHCELFSKAATDPASFSEETDYYVCSVCGYINEGPCDKCPVCGVGANMFRKVD